MATQTVVAVYGVPAGESRVQRLGKGMLAAAELVVVDPPLDAQLAGEHPPHVLRVALASVGPGEPFVELREVSRPLESVATRHGKMWGLELAEPARSPTAFGPDGPTEQAGHPWDADALADAIQDIRVRRAPTWTATPQDRPTRKPHHPHPHPAWLWCRLFPTASFCPHRA